MSKFPKPAPGTFGLVSGTVGLALCITQSIKSHVDAKHERERMQEYHEQKMHYLHEFHRQQLHAKDSHIQAIEAEQRARDAERLAGMFDSKVVGIRGKEAEEVQSRGGEMWRALENEGMEGEEDRR